MSLQEKKLFLLDMDGTLYLDDNLFDGVLTFLAAVKGRGGRYLFLTNNSSNSITNLRSRMMTKLFGEEGGAKDFDAKIASL